MAWGAADEAVAVGVIVAGSAAVGAAVAGAAAVGVGVAGAAVVLVRAAVVDGGDAVAIIVGVDAVGGASQAARAKAISRSRSHLASLTARDADSFWLIIRPIVAGCSGS